MSPATLSGILILSLLLTQGAAYGVAPRLLFAVENNPIILNYHKGQLLRGDITLNLIWYGSFTPFQRTVISDFVLSLNPKTVSPPPSVQSWWKTSDNYVGKPTRFLLGRQHLLPDAPLGVSLTSAQVQNLASSYAVSNAINVVLTAANVTVEGFCRYCGVHGEVKNKGSKATYIWVGNAFTQCPGHCAWPFAKPEYGPQTAPLVPPNGDVGVDGIVINLATLLAGTVTNPYGDGYYQGPAEGGLEAVSACTGMYGEGAYPGYPGKLLVDSTTGASYNAMGLYGRKYLLPAMWDPKTKVCTTTV